MIVGARNILLAQAYLNRYMVFEAGIFFLTGSEVYIADHVGDKSGDTKLFSFSATAIQSSIGGLTYNKNYDPRIVNDMIQNLASFVGFLTQTVDQKDMPIFLRDEKSLYETETFKKYLDRYISYLETYPDTVYIPAGTWSAFKEMLPEYKAYMINSVLEVLYLKSKG